MYEEHMDFFLTIKEKHVTCNEKYQKQDELL